MVLRLSLYLSCLPCGTQTIPLHITVFLVVLRVSLYSSQSHWRNSDYTYAHHRLPRGTQTISILIIVSVVVLRLFLYTSQSPWWYSDYPYTPSQSLWWHSDYPYTHHSLSIISDNPYTHRSLPDCTQTKPLFITVSLVALRLSLYSSQYTWWLRPFLYSSQSLWWPSDYPYHNLPGVSDNLYTRHSLPGGTQTHHSLHCDAQTIPILITVSMVVLRLCPYSSQ